MTEQPKMTVGSDGTKEWCVNGKFHRTDGPAVEQTDGTRSWWAEGRRHRTDGPAVESAGGSREWWVEDKCLGGGSVGFWALFDWLTENGTADQQAKLLLDWGDGYL